MLDDFSILSNDVRIEVNNCHSSSLFQSNIALMDGNINFSDLTLWQNQNIFFHIDKNAWKN